MNQILCTIFSDIYTCKGAVPDRAYPHPTRCDKIWVCIGDGTPHPDMITPGAPPWSCNRDYEAFNYATQSCMDPSLIPCVDYKPPTTEEITSTAGTTIGNF